MNKAVTWNITGVGFDAREAAREAARRQGKSLGEWLHGVIADRAAETGGEAPDMTGQERIRAVTARLERLSAANARDHRDREEAAAAADDEAASLRGGLRLVGDAGDRTSRHRVAIADAETLLDQAIDAMELRAQKTERRTDDAIASFAKLLETSERHRESERSGVAALADKLANIEAKITDRDQNPVKGALARLEARLEQIGRRSEAESSARLSALSSARTGADVEPIRRLEEKLNAVLVAISSKQSAAPAQTSPVALAVAQGHPPAPDTASPLRHRRLGEAIADIAERQKALDTGRAKSDIDDPAGGGIDRRTRPDRFDDIRRAVVKAGRAKTSDESFDLEVPRGDVGSKAEQLRGLAPPEADGAAGSPVSHLGMRLDAASANDEGAAIASLKAEVQGIGGRIDEIARSVTPIETTKQLQNQLREIHELVARRSAPTEGPDVAALETLVRDLGRRMEAVQSPGASQPAVDALQQQVGALAARLDSAEAGLASFSALERSMRDLFTHLEQTRSLAETSASRAAQEAVRTAIADRGFDRPAPRADVAMLKAMQEEADLRTRATLEVMHETLDKVIDRLALVEHGLTEPRPARPAADQPTPSSGQGRQPPSQTPPALGATEPMLDFRFGPPRDRATAPPPGGSDKPADLDSSAGKADYIAAARRAANAAQTDPSVLTMRRPTAEKAAARADLMAKSRDYVASHKRPVLLALAAVLVVAATMALVQSLPFAPAGPQVAGGAPARRATTTAASAPTTSRESAQLGAMTPNALPHSKPSLVARIPGSDPVVTGSIPNLPAFAARAVAPPSAPTLPTLPAGLTTMAEAGDGAAEYTLATAFSEGRGVPRDFQRAAKLYAKAAAQGIVPAQYRLGALYERGLGVAQDKARAKSLYRQAAEAGNPRAMHNLAVLLADGDGKPDYEGAATWFRKAAQHGVRDSQYNLAILLARGLGVDQSLVQSYQWFAIAAAQGDADAAQKRDEVASKLSASELSVAKALASAFHPRGPDPAATGVAPPPGGWDGASAPLHLNSARSKISSL